MSYFACGGYLPEWAADVPKDWSRNWLKWSVHLSTKCPTEEEKEILPYLSNEHVASWTGKLLIDEPRPADADSRMFRKDDILFNKLRPYLAKVYHATFEGVKSSELLCLRPSDAVEACFLFYVLVSRGFIDAINAETFGAKMPRADWEIVGHQPLPLPPLDTQRQIAQFLDEKTARIDTLIGKKRELLERLAEKRQALITRAVTKGLDPDAPITRSDQRGHHQARRRDRRAAEGAGRMSYFACGGYLPEWAADVPKDWSRNWLKWSVHLSTKCPTEEEKEILPYLSNEHVASWTGKLLIDEPRPADADSRMFRKDDILFNKLRPYLAKVYHATFEGVKSSELLCLRPSDAVEARFLFYVLVSRGFIDAINAETFGAKMPRADWEIVGHQPLPLPPLDMQRRIAQFLDEKTSQIDEQCELIVQSLETLVEYRTALITAATTGKIDVCNIKQPTEVEPVKKEELR